MEDDPEATGDSQQDINETEHQLGQDGAAQAEQVKVEADKGGHSRKRPHEENRGYGYYEHREDKRYAHHIL